MDDTVDWKKKHLDALRDMEAEEARWRAAEQSLRRLVSRLCAVAHGPDATLNEQLGALAEAARRGVEPLELVERCDSLTAAVRRMEQSNAPPPPEGPAAASPLTSLASLEAVVRLIDRLEPEIVEGDALTELRTALGASPGPDLAPLLTRLADLIAERAARLGRERSEAAAMLAGFDERLQEMTEFLTSTDVARHEDHEATESLNVQMLAHVAGIADDVHTGTDLAVLRTLVSGRLDAVALSLRQFREREARRLREHDERGERMRARIRELEQQTQGLARDLDAEKRRARTDPLTRIANRASFDERLAQEVERRRRFPSPTTLLVWDIDRFKRINDTHGHRTGDALLQVVAAALSRGRRAVDLVARYGGEEFVALYIGTPLGEALRIAEEIRTRIATTKLHYRGTPIAVTVSCGLTELRAEDTAASVFERADAALYRAKDGGRNACVAD